MRWPLKIVAWWIGIPSNARDALYSVGPLSHHDPLHLPKGFGTQRSPLVAACVSVVLSTFHRKSCWRCARVRRIEHEIELYSGGTSKYQFGRAEWSGLEMRRSCVFLCSWGWRFTAVISGVRHGEQPPLRKRVEMKLTVVGRSPLKMAKRVKVAW